jgi:CBS domain-containing protein
MRERLADISRLTARIPKRGTGLSSTGRLHAGLVPDDAQIVSVDINTPTLDALKLLVKHNRSAVAVLSPDGKLVTNLSSSDLRFDPGRCPNAPISSPVLGVLKLQHLRRCSCQDPIREVQREVSLRCAGCRNLQPNHFGVFALPVGEFLGLLHGAVYVGTHALDGDLSRTSSSSRSPSAGGAAAPQPLSHQFFAQREGQERPVPLVTCAASATVAEAMGLMVERHVHRVYVVKDPAAEEPEPLAVVTTTDMMRLVAENMQ